MNPPRRKRQVFAVIMAGGKGTRFWPLSRNARPKQLLKIFGDSSMLQMTVDRLRKISFVEEIYIICGAELKRRISKNLDGVEAKNIIVEPSGKNTMPSIGLMAEHIVRKDGEAVMAVFPADHLIIGHRAFLDAMKTAHDLALQEETLVTLGVVPSSPHTGYGYIQFNRKKNYITGKAYGVKTFAEKPNLSTAKRFLKSGDFLWNSGMFVWRASVLLKSVQQYMPEDYIVLEAIGKAIGTRDYRNNLEENWGKLMPESVDYAILERTQNISVVQAEFQWSDIGSWNAYFELLPKNGQGNVIKGDGMILDGSNNLVHSNGRFTAVVGADNMVVINTKDATLVVSMDRVEEVKRLVEKLKEKGREEVL
ncbi:MAG: mannose-1-phosphate guanylyltransferase [Fidelibacterota bacterium]